MAAKVLSDERTSAAAGSHSGCVSAAGSNNASETNQGLRGRPFHVQELLCVRPDYGAVCNSGVSRFQHMTAAAAWGCYGTL